VGFNVGSNRIVYLHRGSCMPSKMVVIPSFPNISEGENNFMEKSIRGGI
jgi:hypothetical protein